MATTTKDEQVKQDEPAVIATETDNVLTGKAHDDALKAFYTDGRPPAGHSIQFTPNGPVIRKIGK